MKRGIHQKADRDKMSQDRNRTVILAADIIDNMIKPPVISTGESCSKKACMTDNINSVEECFGQDSNYVSCGNDIDKSTPTEFQYSPVNLAGPGMNLDPSEIVYSGCNCTTPLCGEHCPCIQRFGPNYTTDGKIILPKCVLTKDVPATTKPIIECNSSCKCSSECVNRVVQNGIQHMLQVYKTDRKGWGLRAFETIPQNSFVCEYAGEILPYDEAKRRSKALTKDDMNYILVVRETIHKGDTINTCIDPTYIGNVGRFINHSCESNLFQVIVRVDNEIPRVALFARKDIDPYKELTYSYWGDKYESCDSNELTTHKQCQCESDTCIGFLPVDNSLF